MYAWDNWYRMYQFRRRHERIDPLNPSVVWRNFEKHFPPTSLITERGKAFSKFYDFEMIIKDVYNQVDSGDIDWAYLTKVYEIKD
jgi:hypothetical protein